LGGRVPLFAPFAPFRGHLNFRWSAAEMVKQTGFNNNPPDAFRKSYLQNATARRLNFR
jgi:hypothetical protein